MSDVLSPFTVSPPPPPSSSSSSSSTINNMSMLYYGLVVIGTAAAVLAIYNLIIIKCFNNNRRHHPESQPQRPDSSNNNNRLVDEVVVTTSEGARGRTTFGYNNNNINLPQRSYLLSSFKYKKELAPSSQKEGLEGIKDKQQKQGCGGGGGDDESSDDECPVCLSIYEEGEDVRKLPRCKHSFHAICIDMWLYSHFDCPICRTPVGPFTHPFPPQNSRP